MRFNEVAQRARESRGQGKTNQKKKFEGLLESLGLQGMPISMWFSEWGVSKGDVHITVQEHINGLSTVTSLPTFPDHARGTFGFLAVTREDTRPTDVPFRIPNFYKMCRKDLQLFYCRDLIKLF